MTERDELVEDKRIYDIPAEETSAGCVRPGKGLITSRAGTPKGKAYTSYTMPSWERQTKLGPCYSFDGALPPPVARLDHAQHGRVRSRAFSIQPALAGKSSRRWCPARVMKVVPGLALLSQERCNY